MCSFLFTTLLIRNLTFLNQFMRRRGPDATTHIKVRPSSTKSTFTFVHNLLHMTGERKLQPFRYHVSSSGKKMKSS